MYKYLFFRSQAASRRFKFGHSALLFTCQVSGLWYDQFALDCTYFAAQAGPPGLLLAYLLDHKWALRSCILASFITFVGVFHKPLTIAVIKVL
jgi:hypothetical protein